MMKLKVIFSVIHSESVTINVPMLLTTGNEIFLSSLRE